MAGPLVRVQSTGKVRGDGTITLTFASPPTVGNGLVVMAGARTPSGTSCSLPYDITDNLGNRYLVARAYWWNDTNGWVASAVWYCERVTVTGTLTISIPAPVGAGPAVPVVMGCALEIGNVGAGLMLDYQRLSNVPPSGAGSGTYACALGPLTGPETLSVAMVTVDRAMSAVTVSAGWTDEFEELAITGSAAGAMEAVWLIASSTTGVTHTPTWTMAPILTRTMIIGAAFRPTTAIVANTTPQTAIDIPSLPYSATVFVGDTAGPEHLVYWKYTAKPGDVAMGIWNYYAPGGSAIKCATSVLVGTDLNNLNWYGDANWVRDSPLQMPIDPGRTYYFEMRVDNTGGGQWQPTTQIVLSFLKAPNESVGDGGLIFGDGNYYYDDSVPPPSMWIHLSEVDGHVAKFTRAPQAVDYGTRLPSGTGIWFAGWESHFYITNKNLEVIGTHPFPTAGVFGVFAFDEICPSLISNRFFVADAMNSGIKVTTLNPDGTYGTEGWTPPWAYSSGGIGVSPDDRILYATRVTGIPGNPQPIGPVMRYDLVARAMLPNWALTAPPWPPARSGIYTGANIVLADGSIVITWVYSKYYTTDPANVILQHISSSGVVLHTWDFHALFGGQYFDGASLRHSANPDEFWVWSEYSGSTSDVNLKYKNKIVRINVTTGTIVQQFTHSHFWPGDGGYKPNPDRWGITPWNSWIEAPLGPPGVFVTQFIREVAYGEDGIDLPPIGPCDGGGDLPGGVNPDVGENLATATTPMVWVRFSVGGGQPTPRLVSKVAINYGPEGRKEPRILSAGVITRALTDTAGRIETAAATVTLDDTDREMRRIIEVHPIKGFYNQDCGIYLSDLTTIKAGGEPRRIFFGKIKEVTFPNDFQCQLVIEDQMTFEGSTLAGDTMFPKHMIASNIVDGTRGRAYKEDVTHWPAPLCYGSLSDEDKDEPIGVVPTTYIQATSEFSDLGNINMYFVCLGVVKQIQSVYCANFWEEGKAPRTRTRVPEDAYGDWLFVPGKPGWPSSNPWYESDGKRYTVIMARDNIASLLARRGRIPFLVNLCGYEDIGDGSGEMIASLPRQLAHFLINFVMNDYDGDGNWQTEIPLINDGQYSALDRDAFEEAKVNLDNAMGHIHTGAFMIGYWQRQVSFDTLMAQFMTSLGFNARLFINRHGQISLSALNRASTYFSAPRLGQDRHIATGASFVLHGEQVENSIQYTWGRRYHKLLAEETEEEQLRAREPVDIQWESGIQKAEDPTSQHWQEKELKSEIQAMEMIRNESDANFIVQQRLDWMKIPRVVVELPLTSFIAADLELGMVVKIQHEQGIDHLGWASRRCIIERIVLDLDNESSTITVRDLYDLLPDDVPPQEGDNSARLNVAILGVMQLDVP